MNNEELQQLVEKISLKYFNKRFVHQAYFNHRLRTTGGRYLLNNHNIEINKKYYDYYGIKELEGIIKHELCHYHLHIEGKGYKHRDNDFKQLLAQVGGLRYCTIIKDDSSKYYIYKCTQCNHLYERKRKVDVTKYVCGKCRGKLMYREEKKDNNKKCSKNC